MRKRTIVIIIAAVLLVAGVVTVYVNRTALWPSQQMKELTQLETSLSLPKPQERYVDDTGYHTDMKGAQHYDREIRLSYADTGPLDTLRSKLLQNSWKEEQVKPIEGLPYQYFRFVRGAGDDMQCVTGYVNPKASDGTQLHITLQASGSYGCNTASGT